ncbi:LANO_0G16688g1_1 [Lachancea nothofagi CBS 11611]|uniref:pyridoxal kinase n=1 Tax=Lachancea nothofagi CBS 11611 TaxID=1266666 RepID=A0A1G4KKC7_9SACH|nr:LANO_0G16688g1_1 [Lachancea nothofagi CBS 11611]
MPRLLATQSHVVHGFVGNKAATFPLQCKGWDVDCLNSVQFSNHTGYGMERVFGTCTSAQELQLVFDGLKVLSDYDAMLSGYLPNQESVACMAKNYKELKMKQPNLIWLLDPVMGDNGQLYVSKDVIPEYKSLVQSSLVDVITPNQFELEILYGREIHSLRELQSALHTLHKTVPIIVVTSCSPELFNDSEHLYCVASKRGQTPTIYRVPIIDSYFTGVGDLFSALLLDTIYNMQKGPKSKDVVSLDINHVLGIVQKVLAVTLENSPTNIKAAMGSPLTMKEMELRIIESRDWYVFAGPTDNFVYRQLDAI